ncbi:MAG TPA: hypothetical protein VKB67_12600 [Rhizomicrobium sp.]|nr:hypothetical protein [Rhizomicrobium sp.]
MRGFATYVLIMRSRGEPLARIIAMRSLILLPASVFTKLALAASAEDVRADTELFSCRPIAPRLSASLKAAQHWKASFAAILHAAAGIAHFHS